VKAFFLDKGWHPVRLCVVGQETCFDAFYRDEPRGNTYTCESRECLSASRRDSSTCSSLSAPIHPTLSAGDKCLRRRLSHSHQ
jgi:hypothetical protein